MRPLRCCSVSSRIFIFHQRIVVFGFKKTIIFYSRVLCGYRVLMFLYSSFVWWYSLAVRFEH